MSEQFLSLTHARLVRDRLAKWAAEEAVRLWGDDTQFQIDGLCRAEPNYQFRLLHLKEWLQDNWYGNGIPDWSYLDELRSAIAFIAQEEKAQLSPVSKTESANPLSSLIAGKLSVASADRLAGSGEN